MAHARTCIVLTSHHNRDLTWRDLIEEPNSSKNMPKTIPASELLLTVRTALQEDMGSGDLTAMLVSADHSAVATVTSREAAILCGIPWFEECFRELDSAVEFRWLAHEGERLEPARRYAKSRAMRVLYLARSAPHSIFFRRFPPQRPRLANM